MSQFMYQNNIVLPIIPVETQPMYGVILKTLDIVDGSNNLSFFLMINFPICIWEKFGKTNWNFLLCNNTNA